MSAESKIVAPDGTVVAWVCTSIYCYYVLDDSRIEGIHETPAFCWTCGQYVASERIRSAQQCEAEIRWFQTLKGKELEKWEFVHGSEQQLIERNRIEFETVRSRQSPPRCLKCGSTNILQAEVDERGCETGRLMHPDYLPKGLSIEGVVFVSDGIPYRLFSLEGVELPLSPDEIVEIVNQHEGQPFYGIEKNGKIHYGKTFGYK